MDITIAKIGGSVWGVPPNLGLVTPTRLICPPDSMYALAPQLKEMAQTRTVIPVVSAFKGVTNALIKYADAMEALWAHPHTEAYYREPRPHKPKIISSGEEEAAEQLARVLGVRSFTGSLVPFITDDVECADHIDFDASGARLVNYIREGHKMAVVAGFQGVGRRTNLISTFKRGGTDLSAVATAVLLRKKLTEAGEITCQIVRNEGGVRTADPKLVPQAPIHKRLSYEELRAISIAGGGSQLIQAEAARLAAAEDVDLSIGPLDNADNLTHVAKESHTTADIIAIACKTDDMRDSMNISVVGRNITRSVEADIVSISKKSTNWQNEDISVVGKTSLKGVEDRLGWFTIRVPNKGALVKKVVRALHSDLRLAA